MFSWVSSIGSIYSSNDSSVFKASQYPDIGKNDCLEFSSNQCMKKSFQPRSIFHDIVYLYNAKYHSTRQKGPKN